MSDSNETQAIEANGHAPKRRGGRRPAAAEAERGADPAAKESAASPRPATAPEQSGKIPVEHATLHAAIMFQGKTLDHWNETKVPGLRMLWVKGEGLLIGVNGHETLVPSANVRNVVFAQRTTGRVVA